MTDWRITSNNGKLVYEVKDERHVDEREYGGWREVEIDVPESEDFKITFMNCQNTRTVESYTLADAIRRYMQLAEQGVWYQSLRKGGD